MRLTKPEISTGHPTNFKKGHTMLCVPGRGDPSSRIWVIGESPGEEEELKGKPFVGISGRELEKMLDEVGIDLSDCYVDNVCQYRPPVNKMEKWLHTKKVIAKKEGFELINSRYAHPLVAQGQRELLEKVNRYHPEVVIGFGNTPLWALTGKYGIMAWRGSEMILKNGSHFVPTIHPAAITRDWALRPLGIHDLSSRVARRLKQGFVTPNWQFRTFPTFDQTMSRLAWLWHTNLNIAPDIETMGGHTVCLGIAWSATEAICIPFIGPDGVYWDKDELGQIVAQLRRVFNRCNVIGQNWAYDRQYLEEDFKLEVRPDFDTLVAQTVLFPGSERGLGYLSSMYCDWHEYWKEDGKEWNKGIKDFDKEFRYNCRDCCADWEVGQVQQKMLVEAGLQAQFDEQMGYGEYVYRMMRRGVTRSQDGVKRLIEECKEAVHERKLFVAKQVGHEVNFNSWPQVAKLFYTELGCKAQKKRGTDNLSTDDEHLKKVMEEHPHVAPVALAILESRSLSKLQSTYLEAEDDPDGQFRSSWMCPGTESFRLSSSTNAFYRGGNLQNITDGKHTHSGRKLPNLRSTIVPPPGYGIFNGDLERADLQVVAWEADDDGLKFALRSHIDIHLMNARDLFGLPFIDDDLRDPEILKRLLEKYEQQRHFGKSFVHGTNYGGKARTMAIQCKCTVREAEDGQKRWFKAHPGILQWHQRTMAYLQGTRTVRNCFGYRRVYFDRIDGVLPEALAWVPQSTVAILIGRIHRAVEDATLSLGCEITMQGHDSIAGIYPLMHEEDVFKRMHEASKIIVPYSDSLYIPLELSTSLSSWGELERVPWPQS